MKHRIVFVLAIAQIGLMVAMLVATLRWLDAKVALSDSLANKNLCEALAGEIGTLRSMSTVANEASPQLEVSNSDLVQVASQCAINANQVDSIRRITPAKIEGTEYERRDIVIDLRDVTVEQVVKLVLQADSLPGGFKATSLSLAARPSGARSMPEEKWNANLTLTQLVFSATRLRD
ncbi:MAG: hypothetical protein AAFX06_21235 [Planctomycetota bacterium]